MQTTQDLSRKNRWVPSFASNSERQTVQQNREFVKLPFSRFPPKSVSAA